MWKENQVWRKKQAMQHWCKTGEAETDDCRGNTRQHSEETCRQSEGRKAGVWVGGLSHSESEAEPIILGLVGGSLLISASGAMQLQSNVETTKTREMKHVGPRCLCAVAAGDWWVSLRRMNHDSRRWKSPRCFLAKPGNRSRRCERWGSLKSWKYQNRGTKMATQFWQSKCDFINQQC